MSRRPRFHTHLIACCACYQRAIRLVPRILWCADLLLIGQNMVWVLEEGTALHCAATARLEGDEADFREDERFLRSCVLHLFLLLYHTSLHLDSILYSTYGQDCTRCLAKSLTSSWSRNCCRQNSGLSYLRFVKETHEIATSEKRLGPSKEYMHRTHS